MAEENWDLQAVVRGGFGRAKQEPTKDPSFPTSCSSTSSSSVLLHESNIVKQDDVFGFPDLISTSAPLQELLELCKPFFPTPSPLQQQQQQQKQKPLVSASPQPNRFSSAASCFRQPLQLPMPPRVKRRKNQQKKVVCQVLAGNHSDDLWAWRKYGQKPIKGSPFPRGYYRCSSSKSCIARKQVERSRMDPSVFIVSYTGEHNHPIPTHRNSLAGSTRHKIPPVPVPITSSTREITDVSTGVAVGRASDQGTNTTPSGLSPTTPLTPAVVEEEEEEEEEDELLMVSDMDMLAEDDMFMG